MRKLVYGSVLGLLAAAMAGLTVPPALEPVTAVVGGVSGGVPERHDLPAADIHATELRVQGARATGGGRLVIPAEQFCGAAGGSEGALGGGCRAVHDRGTHRP